MPKKIKIEEIKTIIQETDELFDYYCNEVEKSESQYGLEWQGDLGGGRTLYALLGRGCCGFVIGMNNGAMLTTEQVKKYHSKMLKDYEKIIKQWRDDHTDCCKKIEENKA